MMGGPILSPSGTGVLELDPSLHHPSALHHHQQTLSHHMQGLAPLSTTQHLNVSQDSEHCLGLESKVTPKVALMCTKGKSTGTSDEDEPSFTEEGDFQLGGKGKKGSPWQRMKWTDSMVKLLINVVLFVGEDGIDSSDGNKRKSGILQKKGKWKSVSRVMNERGCYVSPQQCEDKFNDLNKRYKRLNDILGRGTACCVVENPSLLDSMEHLTSKKKDDVKKILSSKHLFYKEMCSYHSGCKTVVSADFELQPSVQAGIMVKARDCMEFTRSIRGENDMDEDEEDDAEEDDEEGDYEDHDEENGLDTHIEALCDLPSPFGKQRKLLKYSDGISGSLTDYTKTIGLEPLNMDLLSMIQYGTKLTVEQRHLIRVRALQLEEQKVNLQAQVLELEKQRFKWQKFSSKKDRELERLRQDNKRMKLENERISLQLNQNAKDQLNQ